MGRCDQLWSHRSLGPHPAATELGNCWGIAVLCPLGTGLGGFPSAVCGICLEGWAVWRTVPAGSKEPVGSSSRQGSNRPESCGQALGALRAQPPVRLLAALLSPQPLRGRGSLAARKLPCAQGSCLGGQLTKKNSRLARTCLLVFILVVLQPKLERFFSGPPG